MHIQTTTELKKIITITCRWDPNIHGGSLYKKEDWFFLQLRWIWRSNLLFIKRKERVSCFSLSASSPGYTSVSAWRVCLIWKHWCIQRELQSVKPIKKTSANSGKCANMIITKVSQHKCCFRSSHSDFVSFLHLLSQRQRTELRLYNILKKHQYWGWVEVFIPRLR